MAIESEREREYNDYRQTRITMFFKCHAVILINDYRIFNDDDVNPLTFI